MLVHRYQLQGKCQTKTFFLFFFLLSKNLLPNLRFQVRYILSEPKGNDWNGEIGRMTDEIATSLFKTDSQFHSEFCLVCGPLPFNELCEKMLQQAGYDEHNIHYFRG